MTERRFLRLLLYILAVCAAVFLIFRFLLPVLLPFLIAFLFSQLTEPAVQRLQARWKLPRTAITVAVMLLLFLLLSLLLYLLFQAGVTGLTNLTGRLPALAEQLVPVLEALKGSLLSLADKVPDGLGLALHTWVEELFSGTSALLSQASDLLLSMVSGLIALVPRLILFLVTTVAASFMIASQREAILLWLKKRLPENWTERSTALLAHLKQALMGWVKAELRMMLITFAIVTVGLFILGVDYALLMGLITTLVDALPVFGTGTILIPWGVWNLLQGSTVFGAGLLILYGLTAAARTALEPRLVGRQIGLNPLLSLLSMYAGFQLFGIGGMILLPITAMLARQFWVYGGFS